MTDQPTTPAPGSGLGAGEGLLPCPFCGAMPNRVVQNGEELPIDKLKRGGPRYWQTVWCENCGAEGGRRASEDEAVAAWNRRAAPTPTTQAGDAGLREELEDTKAQFKAWFDVKAKADAEIGPVLLDSFKSYLRRCRSGGMPSERSDQALSAFSEWLSLYAGLTLTPFLAALAQSRPEPDTAQGWRAISDEDWSGDYFLGFWRGSATPDVVRWLDGEWQDERGAIFGAPDWIKPLPPAPESAS